MDKLQTDVSTEVPMEVRGESPVDMSAERKCAILMACSRLLSYPDDPSFVPELNEVSTGLADIGIEADHPIQIAIRQLIQLVAQDALGLAEGYVAKFDLNKETTLNITAHEHGDSRDRGPALLELAQMYRAAGFIPNDDQLADYMPQLIELLAVVTDEEENCEFLDELETRIARTCAQIRKVLENHDANDVYHLIFAVLTSTLKEPPIEEKSSSNGSAGVRPMEDTEEDPENMPYPLHYE